ncbi:HKDC1 [Hepatospora eriocheir]|uniref:Phosphotransferase n=1 Tax=Hepatospora eriocheir TaxID=1081669 RepID=A0A1X0QKX3_9MICR|nr:HKDC1 [Hepatospora eriocheir]
MKIQFDQILNLFEISKSQIDEIANNYYNHIITNIDKDNLQKEELIFDYVDKVRVNKENTILLIDMGGTYFKYKIFNQMFEESRLIKIECSDNIEIFEYIANQINEIYLKNIELFNEEIPIILTFSFPYNKVSSNRAFMNKIAKNMPFKNNYLNKEINKSIKDFFNKINKEIDINIQLILNDTVAVLLSDDNKENYSDNTIQIGLVCGTGSNMAFYNENDIIVNAEWYKFTLPENIMTSYDYKLRDEMLANNQEYFNTHTLLSGKDCLSLFKIIYKEFFKKEPSDTEVIKLLNDDSLISDDKNFYLTKVFKKIFLRNQCITTGLIKGVTKLFSDPKKLIVKLNGSVYKNSFVADYLEKALKENTQMEIEMIKSFDSTLNINMIEFN